MSGTSGTYAYNPSLAELMLDAYERCGKIGVDLTVQSQMLSSARRSMNLVLSSWTNRGINLWTVDQVSQFMPQGVVQYFDDASCVNILPDSVVLRQYLMAAPVSVAPAFTTTASSASVTIAGFKATPIAGGYINVGVPVSVGGIVLLGFYQVVSVPGSGEAVVTAASVATSSTTGGAVPSFAATINSQTVTVSLNNHGLLEGQTFNVQVTTTVGGVPLLGPYTVGASPTTNAFTITAPYPAGSTQSGVQENGGETQLATQALVGADNVFAAPVDLLLYPLSRGDYQAIPDKAQQGRPTSFWIDRQVVPVFNIWLVPDANGPYELRYYRSRQVQDADAINGQQLEVPYRFLEAFTADFAAHLAQKWAPDRAIALKAYADAEWTRAADEDRERVSTFFAPDLSGYYTA